MFVDTAKIKFDAEPTVSKKMTSAIDAWMNTYRGVPEWANADDVKTINFAATVCEETARLTTLDIGINLSGGARAAFLQKELDKQLLPRLRDFVEYGAAGGTVIFKPSGKGIDVITPDRFMVTEYDDNKKITGVIFQDGYTQGKDIFTKLEYHRFERRRSREEETRTVYVISTKCFRSQNSAEIGREIPIDSTRWRGIEPEVEIIKQNDEQVDSPLFGVFKMPKANNIDLDSPLGMAIFANAMQEMEDLDIAYSRNSDEINNSNTIELLDDALLQREGVKGSRVHLPSHVHNVFGNGMESFYQQIDRPLKTGERRVGINQQLSFIGYKCGYSEGYFVFDQKTGLVTATQVESTDRRTIQLIKDVRDGLKEALRETIYALNVLADLYERAPVGTYTVDFDFGDITYNEDEDRNRWYQLMMQGIIPKWYYLVKHEGMGEDEAKAIVAAADEANAARTALFAEAAETAGT